MSDIKWIWWKRKEIGILTMIYFPVELTIVHIPVEEMETVIRIYYVRITIFFQKIKQSQLQKNSLFSENDLSVVCCVLLVGVFVKNYSTHIHQMYCFWMTFFPLIKHYAVFIHFLIKKSSPLVYECVFLPLQAS